MSGSALYNVTTEVPAFIGSSQPYNLIVESTKFGSSQIYQLYIPVPSDNTMQLSTVASSNVIRNLNAASTIQLGVVGARGGLEWPVDATTIIDLSSDASELVGLLYSLEASSDLDLGSGAYQVTKEVESQRVVRRIKIKNISNTIITIELIKERSFLKLQPNKVVEVAQDEINLEQVAYLRNEYLISVA